MELKTFIKEALKDIVEAVKESQDELDCGEIVPHVGSTSKSIELGVNPVQSIQFEVSVNVEENEGSAAKLSVVAAIVEARGRKGSQGVARGQVCS